MRYGANNIHTSACLKLLLSGFSIVDTLPSRAVASDFVEIRLATNHCAQDTAETRNQIRLIMAVREPLGVIKFRHPFVEKTIALKRGLVSLFPLQQDIVIFPLRSLVGLRSDSLWQDHSEAVAQEAGKNPRKRSQSRLVRTLVAQTDWTSKSASELSDLQL